MRKLLRSRTARAFVWLLCLLPAVLLYIEFRTSGLGANPIEKITLFTGNWTLRLLLVTLAITPLRRALNLPELILLRRTLGLFAFFYGCLHFTTWIWLDRFFDWNEMWTDLTKRKFIIAGMVAFVAVVPLALTSTNWWIRKLGRNWQRLHRLVYLSAAAGVVHYWWKVKSDIRLPLLYAAILLLLLAARLIWRKRQGGALKPGAS